MLFLLCMSILLIKSLRKCGVVRYLYLLIRSGILNPFIYHICNKKKKNKVILVKINVKNSEEYYAAEICLERRFYAVRAILP